MTTKLKFIHLQGLENALYRLSGNVHHVIQYLDYTGAFNKDGDTYWGFITVNEKDTIHMPYTPPGLKHLLSKFDDVLSYEEVHKSTPFANVNYWEGNYLQFHIYKVAKK